MVVATANRLSNISPDLLVASKQSKAVDVAVFQSRIYLASAYYSSKKSALLLSIQCYDKQRKAWQELAESQLFGDHKHDLLQAQDAPILDPEKLFEQLHIELFVSQDQVTPHPTLYLSIFSPWESKLIRSEDGENFTVISTNQPSSADAFVPLHQFLPCQDKLYALPLATTTNSAWLYSTETPELSNWYSYNSQDFGNTDNQAIGAIALRGASLCCAIATFNNCLYTAITNAESGFQIYKDISNNSTPSRWEPVLTKGAYNYSLNAQVLAMSACQNALYLVSKNATNSSFELIRIYADGDWDVIIGTPKFTPQGLKVPLAAMGVDFDANTSQVKCLFCHEDTLYLGCQTFDGFQLWRTDNGEVWSHTFIQEWRNYRSVTIKKTLSTSAGMVWLVDGNKNGNWQIWLGDY